MANATNSNLPLQSPPFLGGLSSSAFLNEYWQKKYLYLTNAFPELVDCIEANELAGFALEESIESRIILEKENDEWDLMQGPFEESMFTTLPQSHWTLLVQAMDHYIPKFASLLDQFNFLPQWRIDDIMMSYATTGGNVGPHYDYYDVFLIQISGQRHWKVGQVCDDTSLVKANLPVRILEEFNTKEEFTVSPGDVLYLPPGMAHHGVALDDDCITLSVGFRAPSYADMIGEYSHYLAERLPGHARYHDENLEPRIEADHHSGRISAADVERVKHQVLKLLSDNNNIKQWMGEFLSLPKYENSAPVTVDISNQDVAEYLSEGISLQRDESSRFITIEMDNALSLYINGDLICTNQIEDKLIDTICAQRILAPTLLEPFLDSPTNLKWICGLIQSGHLYFQVDDE